MADRVATERIWEAVPVPRTKRTRRVLRFRPGQGIPEAEAKRLNVKADGTQSKVPLAETDVANVTALPPSKAAPAKKAAKKTAAKKSGAKKGTAKKAAARKRA